VADKIRPGPKTVVRATTHPDDTRSNIPTAKLESFARPEEKKPTIVRYPRDPNKAAEQVRAYRDTWRWAFIRT
jgi:hypothetical protein